MAKAVYAILLIGILVFGLFSTSNFASAVSDGTGKLVPSDKISPPTSTPGLEKAPPTSPPGFEKAGMTRVISSTTSEQEISNIQQKGCSVIHKLNHATSFFCPSGVVKTLDNVRPVRIYQPHDLDADIQIQADRVWNELGFDGSGVKVAILDTGVQKSHAELSNSIPLTKDFTGEGGDDLDFSGHGTHVSGIVTSDGVVIYQGTDNLTTGVSPGADIIVGKVCGSSGCPEDAIIAGIEWAKIQGADVMNLSLGGGLSDGVDCDDDGDLTVAAVNDAVASGIVATISSGNDYSKDAVSYPGCASGAIAVGAVYSSDTIAGFSNVGPALDIVAPGVSILSTYSCNAVGDCDSTWAAYLSGTSMSSPHVAGVVALILEKNPTLTVDQVKDALYSTAKKIQSGKWDGNGRVNAFEAVDFVSGTTTPDTTPPVITPNPITDPFEITLTDQYTEYCTATDDDPTYVDNCVVLVGGIDTSVLGLQSVTYTADPDPTGNVPSNVDVSTTVQDITAPTITLNGATPVTLVQNVDTYTELGASVSDNNKATTSTATVGGDTVDVAIVGTYIVKYTATDPSNNLATPVTRTVKVVAATEPITASVSSIIYSTHGGKDGFKHLDITITIINDFANPVSGASVSIDLFHDNSLVAQITGTTETDGTVTLTLNNASTGLYTTTVTDVTATGLTWDVVTPLNEFSK